MKKKGILMNRLTSTSIKETIYKSKKMQTDGTRLTKQNLRKKTYGRKLTEDNPNIDHRRPCAWDSFENHVLFEDDPVFVKAPHNADE